MSKTKKSHSATILPFRPGAPGVSREVDDTRDAQTAHVLAFPKTGHGRNLMARVDQRLRESKAQPQDSTAQTTGRIGDDEWYRAFGARLKAARIAKGVSEEDAAKAAGRSVETWRNYEATGRGHCTHPVAAFAKRYGIRLNDLFADPSEDEVAAVTVSPEAAQFSTGRSEITSRNERLRAARQGPWKRAKALTDWFEAMSSWHMALYIAQGRNVPAAKHCYPKMEIESYRLAYREYEIALFEQMLTPAPDIASVNWKRRRAFGARAGWDADSMARIKAAIATDEEFLKSHPARQPCKKAGATDGSPPHV